MMRLPNEPLDAAALVELRAWQDALDLQPDYAQRVKLAAAGFKSRNRAANVVFAHVREILGRMCCGALRCNYCEDNAASEIEHIAPKSTFPERTFDWSNYLYACGICNRGKQHSFPIRLPSGATYETARKRNDPVVPPPAGVPLVVDPRTEDPFAFIELDLVGTYRFVPRPGIGALQEERARQTIEVLQLNRGYLVKARKNIFESYRDRLFAYVAARDGAATAVDLDDRRSGLLQQSHPSVFEEMKRQADLDPNITAIFAPVPEARQWSLGQP